MKLFGEIIRSLREEQNLPLRKVAAFLDIDTSILSKIERDERPVNKQQIVRIAEYFCIDVKKLQEDYLSEQVAKKVYLENNINQILRAAEKKAKYLKLKLAKTDNIKS